MMPGSPQKPASEDRLPYHVAVVMDGNGRWATSRGLPRMAGHEAGVSATRAIVEACRDRGVSILTLFAFSSENWLRPDTEVSFLIGLFIHTLDEELERLHRDQVRIRFIGNTERFPRSFREVIARSQFRTRHNPGMTLVIAVGYGGRWDILQAARRIATAVEDGQQRVENIDTSVFCRYLALGSLPDPDLLIRTGGERRISNFLLWHLAYTELYFSDVLWPDFGAEDLDNALSWFAKRERRFGKTSDQVAAIGRGNA